MEYKCNHCNKYYASYQSRCNHIRRYHKVTVVVKLPEQENKVVINSPKIDIINDNTICKYCKKKLCDRKYRWKHELNCKSKNSNDIELLKMFEIGSASRDAALHVSNYHQYLLWTE
jgi:hypothetical protein